MKTKRILFLIGLMLLTIVSFIYLMYKAIIFPKNIDNLDINKLNDAISEYDCFAYDKKVKESIKSYQTNEETCPFLIEYTIYKDKNDSAKEYNNYLKEVYDNSNKKVTTEININVGTYFYERETIGTYYKTAILYNNTILYIKTTKDKRRDAKDIKNALGYNIDFDTSIIKYFLLPLLTFILFIIEIIYPSSIFKNKEC